MLGIRRVLAIGALLLAGTTAACGAPSAWMGETLGYVAPDKATAAFETAKREAVSEGKRILIVAGGDWCRWCHVFDRFLREHREIDERLHASFVLLKLEVGDNGVGAEVLDGLPMARGYPHFWVLAADGALLASVETAPLERGDDDYDATAFGRFLDAYAPANERQRRSPHDPTPASPLRPPNSRHHAPPP